MCMIPVENRKNQPTIVRPHHGGRENLSSRPPTAGQSTAKRPKDSRYSCQKPRFEPRSRVLSYMRGERVAQTPRRKVKTMGITTVDIERFAALAGEGFSWAGVRGSSRPAADVRKALRDDLWNRAGRICAVCGEGDNGIPLEFNHVVSRGPGIKGFVRGNIFTGHSSCNGMTKPLYDNEGNLISGVEILPLNHFTRPDVIPTEWTPFPILRKP